MAIKWVLPEADTPKAVRIRNEFLRGIHELLAPDIDPVEIAHALARAERRGRVAGAKRSELRRVRLLPGKARP